MTDEGKLTTADLAKQLKTDPKTLRKHLRALKIKKTEGRYEFAPGEVKKLGELVSGEAKKETETKAAKKAAKK